MWALQPSSVLWSRLLSFIGLYSGKRDGISLDHPGLGPYKVLFNLSEFQFSHLAMGESLAPFRDSLRFEDIVYTSRGT